jgi:hypothetical protein
MYSRLVIRVSPLAMQDLEKEKMMNATYGLISKKLLAVYDQELSYWRTLEDTLASGSIKYLQTLPKSGTTRGGRLYELATLARPIKERGYSLLPTPLTVDAAKGTPSDLNRHSPNLRSMDILPTPTVMHVRNHDEPLYAYQGRVKDYEMGKTKGKPGMSTGLAVRWIDKQFRIHWIKVD